MSSVEFRIAMPINPSVVDNWPTISPVHFEDSTPEIINGWDLRELETAMRASKEETEKCPSIVNGWDQREMEAALKASLEENKKLSKRLEEVESKMTRPNFHSRQTNSISYEKLT